MTELKPCPHCGGIGREVIRFYEEGAATSVQCQTCKVVTAPFLHIPQTIAAWNRRVVTPAQVEAAAKALGVELELRHPDEREYLRNIATVAFRAAGFEVTHD